MNRNFLITYNIDGKTDFAWLESEEEMNEFINELNMKHENAIIHDKLKIYQSSEID